MPTAAHIYTAELISTNIHSWAVTSQYVHEPSTIRNAAPSTTNAGAKRRTCRHLHQCEYCMWVTTWHWCFTWSIDEEGTEVASQHALQAAFIFTCTVFGTSGFSSERAWTNWRQPNPTVIVINYSEDCSELKQWVKERHYSSSEIINEMLSVMRWVVTIQLLNKFMKVRFIP